MLRLKTKTYVHDRNYCEPFIGNLQLDVSRCTYTFSSLHINFNALMCLTRICYGLCQSKLVTNVA